MKRTPSSDENNTPEHSHRVVERMVVIRCMINMGLYWPLWWFNLWIFEHGLYGLWSSLGKMLFYSNLYYMLIGWYLIAKGKPELDRDTVKFSLFIILILVLMELYTIIFVLFNGPG